MLGLLFKAISTLLLLPTLVDVACIIVAEGYSVDDDAIAKANVEDIIILSTKLSSYEAAARLAVNGLI